MPALASGDQQLDVRGSARLRRGLARPRNWWQLVMFLAVGAGGYVVNLAVFALAIGELGWGHRAAAVLAFLVAVSNNFLWNRRWTFAAHGSPAAGQAWRFLVVSLAGLAVNLALLELLVALAPVRELAAQAVAVACATPVNFLGNKLWTFER